MMASARLFPSGSMRVLKDDGSTVELTAVEVQAVIHAHSGLGHAMDHLANHRRLSAEQVAKAQGTNWDDKCGLVTGDWMQTGRLSVSD